MRVDAGPLDRAPTLVAARSANRTFVRAEKNRFVLGCGQLFFPVGVNTYTLLEMASEVRIMGMISACRTLTCEPSRRAAPGWLFRRRLLRGQRAGAGVGDA